jgi:predicted site-specific integrase-resolvase
MLKALKTAAAAGKVGIARHTLQRWIRERQVKAPKAIVQNGRAVRLWSEADMKRLAEVKGNIYRKGRGRKPKPKR